MFSCEFNSKDDFTDVQQVFVQFSRDSSEPARSAHEKVNSEPVLLLLYCDTSVIIKWLRHMAATGNMLRDSIGSHL